LLPFSPWGTGNVSLSLSPPRPVILTAEIIFSLLEEYSSPNKLYCNFYWIFASCLNSFPVECKNWGNFQDHFSSNRLC
jgi:hypothetical protein